MVSGDEGFMGKMINSSIIDTYDAIGIDVDHTLINYKQFALHKMSYRVFATYLIQQHNFPPELLHITDEELNSYIECEIIDYKEGLILKLGCTFEILTAYRGFTKLTEEEISNVYGKEKIFKRFNIDKTKAGPHEYLVLTTGFDSALGILYASMIKLKTLGKLNITLEEVFKHLIETVRGVYNYFNEEKNCAKHIWDTNEFFRELILYPEKYISKGHKIIPFLKYLKTKKKFVFLCTNSMYDFMLITMKYAYGDNWTQFFDLIIFNSKKPFFFEHEQKFRIFDSNQPLFSGKEVDKFSDNEKVYSYGSAKVLAKHLEKNLNKANPKILFIGDSVFNDCYKCRISNFDPLLIIPFYNYETKNEIENNIEYKKYWGNFLNHKEANGETKKTLMCKIIEENIPFVSRSIEDIKIELIK